MSILENKRRLVEKLGGGVFLIVGFLILSFVIYYAAGDLPLWIFGQEIAAEVIELQTERFNDVEDGVLSFNYFVQYRFSTPNGRVFTNSSRMGIIEWSELQEGGRVAVVYFPLYPALNRLDESRFVLFLACTYVPLILMAIAGLRLGWYLLREDTH